MNLNYFIQIAQSIIASKFIKEYTRYIENVDGNLDDCCITINTGGGELLFIRFEGGNYINHLVKA
jgi:hypothetical protein